MKFRIGKHAPERELPVLAGIRSGVGAGVQMMADGNGAYSVAQAVRVAAGLADLGFTWLEEPVNRFRGSQRYPGYGDLAAPPGSPSRPARGWSAGPTSPGCWPTASTSCSPTSPSAAASARRASSPTWPRCTGAPCVPHCWGGAVVVAATLQLLAVIPEPTEIDGSYGGLIEWDTFENPMRTDLLTTPLTVADGRVAIPAGPGLGIEVDEDVVRRLDQLAAG